VGVVEQEGLCLRPLELELVGSRQTDRLDRLAGGSVTDLVGTMVVVRVGLHNNSGYLDLLQKLVVPAKVMLKRNR
jgi:hypothetical protein